MTWFYKEFELGSTLYICKRPPILSTLAISFCLFGMMVIVGGMSLKFLNAIIVFLLNMNWGIGDYTNIRCIESEREALVEFKYSLMGESNSLSSWGDEDGKNECCEWQGVQCSNTTGHVVKLDLKAHKLQGKLSHSLMDLQSLEYLDLSFNNLIEDENLKWLSYLYNLEYLDLSFVYLSKANDWFKVVSGLNRLSTLKLHGCSLPTLNWSPSLINASTSLVILDLHQNHMSLSTSSILFQWLFKSNTTLVSLDLSSNYLSGLVPSSFGEMVVLRDLDLSDNQLEGMVPESFGNLCSLRSLNLSRNLLNGSLAFLHNFSSCANSSMLESLRLNSNMLDGSLPDLYVFPWLKEIDLYSNRLNGTLTKSIGNLFELEALDVSFNSLEGVISELYLSNLSRLSHLDLSSNSFTLKLSFDWVPSFNLKFVGLRSCKLGPDFPNWLATQKNIYHLDISDNHIFDTIPKWFWDTTLYLHHLSLSSNRIYGRLPNISTKFHSLDVLDLSSNSIEGPLPSFPTKLTLLNLANNFISGSISSLCNTLFKYLNLSNNKLSGVLPDDCVSKWSSLRILNLADNNFSGKIPSSIGSLRKIQTLNLRNNSFFGELPSSMRDCQKLIFIDLGENNFSGEVPLWIGERLLSLRILILQSNNFNGSIPLSFCGLIYLHILDLSHNKISGNIPQCLDKLTAMTTSGSDKNDADGLTNIFIPEDLVYWTDTHSNTYENSAVVTFKVRRFVYSKILWLVKSIDLSSNQLSGKFPQELGSLCQLILLNLSRNDLSGELPQNMGEMGLLEALDLSQNQFSGGMPTSLSDLVSLRYLNLSYNNFSGRIPSRGHLSTFLNDSFIGNQALCGFPLEHECRQLEATFNQSQQDDEYNKLFYLGMATGIFVGYWGIFGSLVLSRTWRHAYFTLLSTLNDWILLRLALSKAKIQRRLQRGG